MLQRPRWLALVCVIAFAWTSPASPADPEEAVPEEPSTWDQVLVYYEKAKAAGEQVPQDAYEWAKQDLSSIGDWEYRVRELTLITPKMIEDQLNTFGAERWECIWIEQVGDKTLFMFKRPVKSYLQNLSLGQLMKLVPQGESGDSGD